MRCLSFVLCSLGLFVGSAAAQEKSTLTVVVLDPLALQLSCPCVKGYAQRDYLMLGKHIEKHLGRPVAVHFAESLNIALNKKTMGKADLIIGKESNVRHESKALSLKTTPILHLTGKDGKTTMTGLFVVPAADPALTVADLKSHTILFGPPEADEKRAAPLQLLREFEVAVPKMIETCNSCSEGALKILEMSKEGKNAAAVISSYAQPLLEGCGTIKKGEIRVIGETEAIPFVVAFVTDSLPAHDRAAVEKALLAVSADAALCAAMETRHGFVKAEAGKKK